MKTYSRRAFLKLSAFALPTFAFLLNIPMVKHVSTPNRAIVGGRHPKDLWPGVHKYWSEQYDKCKSQV